MIDALNALLAPALMERLMLLTNHVLASEPMATARLQPHAGRLLRVELDAWPRLLPAPPRLAFRITSAGLVEWVPDAGEADLRLRIDASNPAALGLQVLSGTPPVMVIEGDAQFATDIDWLSKHLRWDMGADLERLLGPVVAHQLVRIGSWLARGLRAAVQAAGNLERMRPAR